MDFQLSDDQRALRAGTRELLAGRFGRDRMRAALDAGTDVDRVVWGELGAAGFFALRLPEAEGGVGLGLPEAVLLFEEAGRMLLPGPLAATHLAAGAVKGAAEGGTVVAVLDEGRPVAHLGAADALIAVVDGEVRVLEGAALRTLVRGAARPVRSLDPLTPLHRVRAPAALGDPLPGAGAARFRREGTLLSAAEQLGSAARTTEMAVQHARGREQFGSPIGAFQAVKHLCAQMLVRAELARAAVYAAAVTADPVEIAGAKLLADEAAVRNARDCLQVHGGMGFTWEADVHLHLKRAWLRAGQWLTAAEAEEALAADLC
ncbi:MULTISPECIES: acyl-CoA dehydrogenase family protein [unclassified Streptomyces]|uniref:acyl-CoA dehydrogenase family protein n=1 Tax=unclassified Streptomyces TaxID=2593676 RepID=UPI002E8052C9|nr:acyl-CoA dehydrogenase family protein [Streptomyces sp. NBC_00562]WTC80373.1 acyl-CoA/acyl-ACP dehydrogenase [Streptomyces sp. NBC_01653]WTD35082.1 acyl-CoA/acyl-ACP dehydrogenase [Streptomyces sp. NBC_01643]WTD90494.1 acyl-CoA/acyl-ACP dehydrogenase [Streptomyces sp. NBC_01637]WUC21469.1 acyl-CoA/acyl-ACP dehydrogenase [Streptomyces sp. NBC_00562]